MKNTDKDSISPSSPKATIKQIKGCCSPVRRALWGKRRMTAGERLSSPLGTTPCNSTNSSVSTLYVQSSKNARGKPLDSHGEWCLLWTIKHLSTSFFNFNLSYNWNKCLHSTNSIHRHLDLKLCPRSRAQQTKHTLTMKGNYSRSSTVFCSPSTRLNQWAVPPVVIHSTWTLQLPDQSHLFSL